MALIDRAQFRARLVAAGLAKYADRLVAGIEPSIRLVPVAAQERDLPIGATRLGGRPDLPAGFVWPTYQGLPLSFIAQLDLATLRGLPGADRLPADGLLSFFYDADQQAWGYDPQHRGGAKVIYTASGQPLTRIAFPTGLPKTSRYGACRLEPQPDETDMPWMSFDFEQLGMSEAEGLDYPEAAATETPMLVHRLLGHPDVVQTDMQREAQLVTNGIAYGGETRDPRERKLLPGSGAWRLLLQIDTDDGVGMMWGDCGRIFYWMHRDDLAARRFERAWCILQCT